MKDRKRGEEIWITGEIKARWVGGGRWENTWEKGIRGQRTTRGRQRGGKTGKLWKWGGLGRAAPFPGFRIYNANQSAHAPWQRGAPQARLSPFSLYISNSSKQGEIPSGHFRVCFVPCVNSQLGIKISSGRFIIGFYTFMISQLGIHVPSCQFMVCFETFVKSQLGF